MPDQNDTQDTMVPRLPSAPEQRRERVLSRSLGFGFVVFVALALVLLLGYGFLGYGGGAGASVVGKQAPDFSLELFDGQTFTLSEMGGQPVVINLWASWCHECREEAEVLEQGWRTYEEQGVIFLGVSVKDNNSDARRFIEEFQITYPNGPDSDDHIYEDYRATGVPETFFINSHGLVVRRFIGPLEEDQLTALVEEILP